MLKVYVAARYSRMIEMREVHAALHVAGIETTSRWVDGAEGAMSRPDAAQMDVDDVLRADAVLLFSDAESSSSVGGGRFFEMGLAYRAGKPVVTCGPRQIIFHHLLDMIVRDTLEECVAELLELQL